ncbi:MAG: hypothetical protein NTZ19_09770 [Bacteroidetes bacterium]|nr:hypothetical protein [Bacteroidota bacterium]
METNSNSYNSALSEKDSTILKDLFRKLNNWKQFLLTQWLKIGLVTLLGSLIGFGYAWLQPKLYQAKISFVVEDAKNTNPGLGNISSLAGQFGLDLGGNNSSNMLSGDNILYYFRSLSLAKEVLLSSYDSTDTKSLIDEYIAVYELKNKWKKIDGIEVLNFHPLALKKPYSVLQDSLIQLVSENILKEQFSVERIDKKTSIIEVGIYMKNEQLSKKYCERLVNVAVNRYIQLKTKKQKSTVDKLQNRVDSIAALLAIKTYASANLQTTSATIDINDFYRTNAAVATETATRDKSLLASIFASVTQNLEVAKFTLSQETPVIQILDGPVLPLKEQRVSKLKMLLIFGFIFGFVFCIYSITKHELKGIF